MDGRGPFTFLLDTGSSTSVLDRALARALGLVPEGEVEVRSASGPVRHQLVRVPSFDLPGVRLTGVTWTAAPLRTTLRSRLGRDVHGLVGADLLRRFVTVVDYSRGRLSLHDPDDWEAPMGAVALPLEVTGGVPSVRISVDGEAAEPFVVDTGSEIGAVFGGSDLARRLLGRHGPGSPAVADGVSGPVSLTALRVASLEAGPFRVAFPVLHVVDAPPAVSGGTALLGTPFLSRFTCAFDLSRDRLWLVPDARYGDPEPLDRSGLALGWEDGDWRVHAVARGSPAEAAGLPVGALVRAIQGTPLTTSSRGSWRSLLAGAAGRQVVLEIGRPGERGRRVRLDLAPPPPGRPPPP
ncbi:aspartyl protease family protein [Myxococcota bacterium]|nr:aspartyl protease family protein [Myxococcota bacterium]